MTNLAIVLLAAGGSTRMGSPKQLLDFKGKKLIQIVVERLLACRCFPTVVVLGAHAENIAPYCDYHDLNVIENPNWQTGLASSIRCGLEFVETMFPEAGHLMLAFVDQPQIEAEHYYALVEASERFPDKVIAAYYDGQVGAPMVFPRRHFALLSRLTGDRGAALAVRVLDATELMQVPLPMAAVDWNWPGDVGNR
jgi:molybdenum cofactor cytidylyltransferase